MTARTYPERKRIPNWISSEEWESWVWHFQIDIAYTIKKKKQLSAWQWKTNFFLCWKIITLKDNIWCLTKSMLTNHFFDQNFQVTIQNPGQNIFLTRTNNISNWFFKLFSTSLLLFWPQEHLLWGPTVSVRAKAETYFCDKV